VKWLSHNPFHRQAIFISTVFHNSSKSAKVHQRITSLYGLVKAKPPKFFEGNAKAFTGLYFNLEDEVFEFYTPAKMKDNPLWLSVTEVLHTGPALFMQRIFNLKGLEQQRIQTYINRINSIYS
jgi:hypothetical protein